MKVTEEKISKKGGFGKGKSYVDQIFAIRIMVKEYLRNDEKMYAAFMDLEKVYKRVDL